MEFFEPRGAVNVVQQPREAVKPNRRLGDELPSLAGELPATWRLDLADGDAGS
jgi:hypothetical protein